MCIHTFYAFSLTLIREVTHITPHITIFGENYEFYKHFNVYLLYLGNYVDPNNGTTPNKSMTRQKSENLIRVQPQIRVQVDKKNYTVLS